MRLFGLSLLCLLIACSESFDPAWLVTNLRVVGARVEVDGQPERARPEPGDDIQVSVLVIDEGAEPSKEMGVPALTPELLHWAFVACIPQATLIGPPICRTIIEPCEGCEGAPSDDRLAFPVLRFQVPDQTALDAAEADSVVVQGAVCIHGVPSLEAIQRFLLGETDDLQPCVPDPDVLPGPNPPKPEGRIVTVRVSIEPTPEDPNLNPEIFRVSLNGRGSWPPPYHETVPRTAPREGCAADLEALSPEDRAAHPRAGDPPSSINLLVTPQSLQSYVVDDVTLTEELQVSWLTDGGNLERTFSFITDPARSVLTQWRPFTGVPEDGGLVRFTFVIRDGRGGTDWRERGLCILPAQPAESPP